MHCSHATNEVFILSSFLIPLRPFVRWPTTINQKNFYDNTLTNYLQGILGKLEALSGNQQTIFMTRIKTNWGFRNFYEME